MGFCKIKCMLTLNALFTLPIKQIICLAAKGTTCVFGVFPYRPTKGPLLMKGLKGSCRVLSLE